MSSDVSMGISVSGLCLQGAETSSHQFKQKRTIWKVLGCSQNLWRLETQAAEGQEAEWVWGL